MNIMNIMNIEVNRKWLVKAGANGPTFYIQHLITMLEDGMLEDGILEDGMLDDGILDEGFSPF